MNSPALFQSLTLKSRINMNHISEKIIVFSITGVLVGLIVTKQLLLAPKFQQITDQDRVQMIALETAELYQANSDLQKEIDQLIIQKNQLSGNTQAEQSEEALKTAIEQMEIMAGQKPIIGPGVTLIFDNQLELTDLVDLVNALRNIGAEGLAINGQRFIANSGFTDNQVKTNSLTEKLVYPLTINVIGSADILAGTLTRKGGVLSQINQHYTIEKIAAIELPANQ